MMLRQRKRKTSSTPSNPITSSAATYSTSRNSSTSSYSSTLSSSSSSSSAPGAVVPSLPEQTSDSKNTKNRGQATTRNGPIVMSNGGDNDTIKSEDETMTLMSSKTALCTTAAIAAEGDQRPCTLNKSPQDDMNRLGMHRSSTLQDVAELQQQNEQQRQQDKGKDGSNKDDTGDDRGEVLAEGGEFPKDTSSTVIVGKEAVSKDERRIRKISIRVLSGALMVFAFLILLYLGHVYICALVAFLEVLLFRELVKVRYNTFFHIIEETIPLFRTTQWMWFLVAIFYTYSDFVVEIIKSNTALHHLLIYAQLQAPIAFVLYSGTFVLTIATMQIGHIRFQLNQLCWTIVVLCLTVGQLKYIMHNVYNGLIWFALPIFLVISNDIFAYCTGMVCGRKFIRRPFINLSPNKTWEGFIGGWVFTMIISWYLSRFMAQFTWMTCPTNKFTLLPERLECNLDPIFHEANNIFPPQIFELFPVTLMKMIPGVVDVCSVNGDSANLTACISGEPTHSHHHFELVVKNVYPVQIHALSLGMFASLVAPFGGFLASGIKRAYGVKDFDSIIPGHGGVMDRMDCQFLMALCTWVHYNTFVKMATISVPKMIYMYSLLRESEQKEFLERITKLAAETGIEV